MNMKIAAIPPDGYRGTIADWLITLQEKGFWDGNIPEFYGDVQLTEEQYVELLEKCEANA